MIDVFDEVERLWPQAISGTESYCDFLPSRITVTNYGFFSSGGHLKAIKNDMFSRRKLVFQGLKNKNCVELLPHYPRNIFPVHEYSNQFETVFQNTEFGNLGCR